MNFDINKNRVYNVIIPELEKFTHSLNIVEVGSIREFDADYFNGDGYSTFFFAQYISRKGGKFTSIDIKTSVAREVINEVGLIDYVTFIDGDGKQELIKIDENSVDICYLDGGLNSDEMLEQFIEAMRIVKPGGLIFLDDYLQKEKWGCKPEKTVEYMNNNGLEFTVNQMIIKYVR